MKKTSGKIGTAGLCAAILAVFLLVSPSAQATSGNVNFFVGQKSMDDSDYWDPTDDQTEFGLTEVEQSNLNKAILTVC